MTLEVETREFEIGTAEIPTSSFDSGPKGIVVRFSLSSSAMKSTSWNVGNYVEALMHAVRFKYGFVANYGT